MNKLIIASNNKHKITEIRQILTLENYEILDMTNFPDLQPEVEDGQTLSENAIKKANHVYKSTGILSLADDSGLVVDYLLGEPGVYSSRYAGLNVSYKDNNRKLLHDLKGLPPRKRKARFKCCVALIGKGIKETVEGVVEGKILFSNRGENGFGYDPLFLPDGYTTTFAEMNNEQKNKISHRARALQMAKNILLNLKY